MECSAQHIRIPNDSQERSFNHKNDEMRKMLKKKETNGNNRRKTLSQERKNAVFWDVTSCSLVGRYQSVVGTRRLHLHGCTCIPNYTVSHRWRQIFTVVDVRTPNRITKRPAIRATSCNRNLQTVTIRVQEFDCSN